MRCTGSSTTTAADGPRAQLIRRGWQIWPSTSTPAGWGLAGLWLSAYLRLGTDEQVGGGWPLTFSKLDRVRESHKQPHPRFSWRLRVGLGDPSVTAARKPSVHLHSVLGGAELLLALWLVVVGVNSQRWIEQAGASARPGIVMPQLDARPASRRLVLQPQSFATTSDDREAHPAASRIVVWWSSTIRACRGSG